MIGEPTFVVMAATFIHCDMIGSPQHYIGFYRKASKSICALIFVGRDAFLFFKLIDQIYN